MNSDTPITESRPTPELHQVPDDTVLIIGGGPVGLMVASVLAYFGVRSIVFERNAEPTRWPKMDLTNARSMELLRKIGLADQLRELGVPSEIPYTVLMSTGLSQDSAFASWDHLSVDQYRENIKSINDGSQPAEPYLRVSQSIFETWMRDLCQRNPLIDLKYGYKLESIQELEQGARCTVAEVGQGERDYISSYVIACDGASSRCRKSLNIDLDGGPTEASFLLVHFKSHDVEHLHKQGRFWHLFMFANGTFGGAVISQDEKDIFTVHYPLLNGVDESSISSEDAIYTVLGGLHEPYKIRIDEVLVRSTFRPSIAVANSFASPNLRIFFAGDSAHQNIPTGGYGMNTGLGDAFDIGWKLAAVINGHAHSGLLKTYETERKPIAYQNVQRSGVHMGVHLKAVQLLGDRPELIESSSPEGVSLRKALSQHYNENDGENRDMGIEMGYRYDSPVCLPDSTSTKPGWEPRGYLPTTWPGSRAPHVILSDKSSIFDHLGPFFTLVEFQDKEAEHSRSRWFIIAANALNIPLKLTQLRGEALAEKIWERPLVLVRPDGHVAWRGYRVDTLSQASGILEAVLGYHC
ncbi:unnamed protein product [Clonostachys byssicola]|uniref:FAD-binding domain-containing protein n=1 Tax=Clonostachys byssicola TaxID=160290 RepID=A0A9N9UI72_9HYPO|nr:unnamed protein product [Clonostachys byssicola]